MSSRRTILSRPRTRVYDANYNIGESMYRPALDRLNRKYSGRPVSPARTAPSLSSDLLERHERAFTDDNIENCRRRAEKHITGESFFDSRGARLDARELLDNFDEETVSRIKSIRASKKVSTIDDVGMEGAVNCISAQRFLDRTDKILDTVGITKETSIKKLLQENQGQNNEEYVLKRRSLRINQEDDSAKTDGLKWTALKDETEKTESGASLRAKQSRARINDIDDEMEALAERQQTRERRAARLRALIAEVNDDSPIPAPISASATSTRKMVRIRDQEELSY